MNYFRFPKPEPLTTKLADILEQDVNENFYLKNNRFMDCPIVQDYSYCIDSNYWKGSTLSSFLEKRRRQLVTDKINEYGEYMVRRLTPHEAWRLMGVSDEDFHKVSSIMSNTSLYKQAGNSIVVSVLERIFANLFINYDTTIQDPDFAVQLPLFN